MTNISKNGFTLIELSIVLVIIGLLVGGILYGRDLIYNASIRAVVSQYQQYDTAIMAFKGKYNCLPGDCVKAVSLGLGDGNAGNNGVRNGNGDGCIDRWYQDGASSAHEVLAAWYHLFKAHLISFQPDVTSSVAGGAFPPTKAVWTNSNGTPSGFNILCGNDTIDLTNTLSAGSHYFAIMTSSSPGTDGDTEGAIPPADAFALDSKVDDGLPDSGIARAWGGGGGDNSSALRDLATGAGGPFVGSGGPNTSFCANSDSTPTSYNVKSSLRDLNTLCVLTIKSSF